MKNIFLLFAIAAGATAFAVASSAKDHTKAYTDFVWKNYRAFNTLDDPTDSAVNFLALLPIVGITRDGTPFNDYVAEQLKSKKYASAQELYADMFALSITNYFKAYSSLLGTKFAEGPYVALGDVAFELTSSLEGGDAVRAQATLSEIEDEAKERKLYLDYGDTVGYAVEQISLDFNTNLKRIKNAMKG